MMPPSKTDKDHNLYFPTIMLKDPDLSAADRMLLSVIASYDKKPTGCYLSNEDIGKFINRSAGVVSKMVNRLYPKYIIYNEPSTVYGGRRYVRKVHPDFKRKP